MVTATSCKIINGHGQQLPVSTCPASSTDMSVDNNNISAGWNIQASRGALLTSNPIREIIESINLAENPAKKVIPLSIGDPTIFGNLKPCKEILDSLRKAEDSGRFYGYQTAAGLEDARQAVANYHFKETGNRLEAKDVILTSGCSHAIDLCICVLAQAGQNILIPRPGFPLYKTLASVYGVNYKQYNLNANSNWSIDLEHLESLIDDQTAAIVINNPSNPCGSVFPREHLMEILELAERYKKPIIADEIYDKFVFLPEHYAMHGVAQPKYVNKNNNNINKQQQQRFKTNPQITINDNLPTTTSILIDDSGRRLISRLKSLTSQNSSSSITNTKKNNTSTVRQPKSDGFWSGEDDEEDDDEEEDEEPEVGIDDEEFGNDNESAYNLIKNGWNNNKSTISHTTTKLKSTSTDIRHNNGHGDVDLDVEDDGCSSGPETTMSDETSLNEDDRQQQHGADSPFIALSSLSKRVPILTCGGISKTCRIPGLRLGWIIINDPIKAFDHSVRIGLNRLTQRLMGPNSLVQGALRDILEKVPDSFYVDTMEFIFRNATLCYKRLSQMPGLEPYMPQGSMYLMVRFEPSAFPTIDGDLDFTSKLMNEESVLVLPGKCFEFPNYFRICLTVPTNVMEEALARMGAFCERHHNTSNCIVATNRNSHIQIFR